MDCSNFKNFVVERERMCKARECEDCDLNQLNTNISCVSGCFKNPDKAIAVVQEWSDEHPIATRKSNFLEMFPNAQLVHEEVIPVACAGDIYGFKCALTNCEDCWNTSLEPADEH